MSKRGNKLPKRQSIELSQDALRFGFVADNRIACPGPRDNRAARNPKYPPNVLLLLPDTRSNTNHRKVNQRLWINEPSARISALSPHFTASEPTCSTVSVARSKGVAGAQGGCHVPCLSTFDECASRLSAPLDRAGSHSPGGAASAGSSENHFHEHPACVLRLGPGWRVRHHWQ